MPATAIDVFSEACGATGPLRLDVLGDDGTLRTRRAFDQPFLVVGRALDADLALSGAGVARRHCYLQLIGGRLFCVDLGSKTGLVIDGATRQAGWVDRGGIVGIDSAGLQVRGGDRHDEHLAGVPLLEPVLPLSSQYLRENPLPPLTLTIESKDHPCHAWPISRTLTLLGRAPACRVRLVDPSVSSFHAALVRTPAGAWLVDLLSRQGVWADGTRVRTASLRAGAAYRLGAFTLRLDGEVSTPSPLPRRAAGSARSVAADPAPEAPSGPSRPSADGAAVWRPAALRSTAPPLPSAPLPGPPESDLPVAGVWSREGPAEAGPDPVHQAVLTLAQMLGAMHRDHMALVRDELAEIRRLAQEMHALRTDLSGPATDADWRPVARTGAGSARVPGPTPGAGHGTGPFHVGGATEIPTAVGNPDDAGAPGRRDALECLEIASEFLDAYERKQQGYWSRIVRLVSSLGRQEGLASTTEPVGPAPSA